MKNFLAIGQILIALFLIFFILLQQRGGASSLIFGKGFYATRRGIEKKIFFATIIAGALFIILAILNLLSR
ncbi:hypothetical protein AMJ49_02380 [Parcubacteria bacterium DG_74_2]|nr:MAG: hypothetical protein AMJ49_02380 [Parcubacteria bacterium DG_74_2]